MFFLFIVIFLCFLRKFILNLMRMCEQTLAQISWQLFHLNMWLPCLTIASKCSCDSPTWCSTVSRVLQVYKSHTSDQWIILEKNIYNDIWNKEPPTGANRRGPCVCTTNWYCRGTIKGHYKKIRWDDCKYLTFNAICVIFIFYWHSSKYFFLHLFYTCIDKTHEVFFLGEDTLLPCMWQYYEEPKTPTVSMHILWIWSPEYENRQQSHLPGVQTRINL